MSESAPRSAEAAEELAALRATVAGLAQAEAESRQALVTLSASVEKLERQLARAGKEQFKANALAEAHTQSVSALAEQLQQVQAGYNRALAELPERLATARTEGQRAGLDQVMLVLDRLAEALGAGERLLAPKGRPRARGHSNGALTLGQRLWAAATGWVAARPAAPPPVPADAVLAWLQGLAYEQERLLALLAVEDVWPIETEGLAFDPNQHVAVDTVPAGGQAPPGTVVHEVRRGFRQGDTVWRYAEVIVTRPSPMEPT